MEKCIKVRNVVACWKHVSKRLQPIYLFTGKPFRFALPGFGRGRKRRTNLLLSSFFVIILKLPNAFA